MPNGIDLILADHRNVDALFAEFEKSGNGAIVGQVVDMLKAHDEAERAALYPIAADVLGDADTVGSLLAAHHAVRAEIAAVSSSEGSALVAAFARLRELVTEHVADEERGLLAALQDRATPQQLDELGARLLQAKQRGG